MRFYKYALCCLSFILSSSDAKYNKRIDMPGFDCGRSPIEIDGAVVRSASNPLYENSACVIKFEADDGSFFSNKKISANLTNVHISDCRRKLKVYFSSSSSASPKEDNQLRNLLWFIGTMEEYTLTCGSRNPGVVTSTNKYMTLRLDGSLRSPDKFEIVITVHKTGSSCSEFRCANGKCIDDDLECDNVDHCFDGTDEKISSAGLCTKFDITNHVESTIQLGMGIIFAIVIGVIVVCVLGCVLLVCCCYRSRRSKGTVIRGPPASQTTTTTAVPTQPGYQAGYVPPAPTAYPPPQQPPGPGPYPPAGPQPGPYPPGPYPQQSPAYPQYPTGPVPPPAYHDKPYSDQMPMPYPPHTTQQVQYTASPPDVKVPTAPPNC